MHKVYLGLGSNLGNRESNIREAIRLIEERVGTVLRQSSVIETDPWGFQTAHRFLNAVICIETNETPREVLLLTQQIERDLGRKSKSVADSTKSKASYADRTIDIDILLYDDVTINEPDLKIPHPLMHQRDFVMQPLREIIDKDVTTQ